MYKLIQSNFNPEVQMQTEKQVAGWLASAAFLSGTGWQPVVTFPLKFFFPLRLNIFSLQNNEEISFTKKRKLKS